MFTVDKKHPLDEVFKEIQDEMRNQYSIGYESSNSDRDASFRRIEIKVRISYDDEIDHALRTALAVIKADERVVSVKPAEVVVSKLGENSVELALRCWTERENYWAALYDLQKAVKDRFDAEMEQACEAVHRQCYPEP